MGESVDEGKEPMRKVNEEGERRIEELRKRRIQAGAEKRRKKNFATKGSVGKESKKKQVGRCSHPGTINRLKTSV